MTLREKFIEIGLTWIDVPWRKVGSTRRGVNCLGLPVGVAREMGGFDELVQLGAAQANFDRPLTPRMMVDGMMEHMTMVKIPDARPGDLLLFRINGQPDHIAILTRVNPMIILHSDRDAKKVRNQSLPAGWYPIMAFSIEDFG